MIRLLPAAGLALALTACGGSTPAIPAPALTHSAATATGANTGMTDDMSGMDMSGASTTTRHAVQPQPAVHGFQLNVPLPRPEFVLTDTHGHPYDFAARTRGRVTLLYFGYTQCPYQCPTIMADIGIALRKLSPSARRKITVVFVTTDPAHDTPKALGEWLANFDPHFVGLSGPEPALEAAQRAARVTTSAPRPGEPTPAGPASTAHGGGLLAYGRDDYAHVTYPAGTSSADLVRDLPRLVRRAGNH